MCGEVYAPTRFPAALSSALIMATLEPLPLVPATVITCSATGSSRRSRTSCTRSSPRSISCGDRLSSHVSHADSGVPVGSINSESGRGNRTWTIFEFGQQVTNLLTHLPAIHDHVDCTVIQQKLAALKPFGQALANRLLDDTRPGKSNQCTRFPDIDVAKHRQAGGYSAGCGVRQHRYVGNAPGAKIRERSRRFGHLQQREQCLL